MLFLLIRFLCYFFLNLLNRCVLVIYYDRPPGHVTLFIFNVPHKAGCLFRGRDEVKESFLLLLGRTLDPYPIYYLRIGLARTIH